MTAWPISKSGSPGSRLGCHFHTRVGEPYVPFRELLCQLSGDVEGKLARGAISPESASLLRKPMVLTGQVLVEAAPGLTGLFVPGANLAGEWGKAVAEKAGWLDRLEKLVAQLTPGEGLYWRDSTLRLARGQRPLGTYFGPVTALSGYVLMSKPGYIMTGAGGAGAVAGYC